MQVRVEAAKLLNAIQSVLHLELENAATNLNTNFLAFLYGCWLLQKDECTELRHFIAHAENEIPSRCFGSIGEVMDLEGRVMPADTDICDADFALRAAADHDLTTARKVDNVYSFGRAVCN